MKVKNKNAMPGSYYRINKDGSRGSGQCLYIQHDFQKVLRIWCNSERNNWNGWNGIHITID